MDLEIIKATLFNNLPLFDEDKSLVVCVEDFEFKEILQNRKGQLLWGCIMIVKSLTHISLLYQLLFVLSSSI